MTIRANQQLENALATDSQYGSRFIQQQNANLFLTSDNFISFDATANTLTTPSDLKKFMRPEEELLQSLMELTLPFDSGDCIYVAINRTGASSASVTVAALSSVSITKDTENLFILAYREGNSCYLANGAVLQDDDSYKLGAFPVTSIQAPDTSGSIQVLTGHLDVVTSAEP